MLYRTQVMNNALPAARRAPRVYTVFIEAENEARAMSIALRRTSDIWRCRLGDLELVGRVVDEPYLRCEFGPLNAWLPEEHVLLELQGDGPDPDADPEGLIYARHDDTLLFVGPAWHQRLSAALFWTGVHLFGIDLEVDAMSETPAHKAAVAAADGASA